MDDRLNGFLFRGRTQDYEHDPQGQECVQHTGHKVVLGILHPGGIGAHDLVSQTHSQHQISRAGQIAQLGRAHGKGGSHHHCRCFTAFGLEIEGVAQADRHRAQDRGLAHDRGHQRRQDHRADGQAQQGAAEAAAHDPHAAQGNTLAKARVLNNFSQNKTTNNDDGHFRQPWTIHNPLFQPAKQDI